MANMFDKFASERKDAQEAIESKVKGVQEAAPVKSEVDYSSLDANTKTVLSLSISVEDKKKLKYAALNRGTTIAGIIHEFVQTLPNG